MLPSFTVRNNNEIVAYDGKENSLNEPLAITHSKSNQEIVNYETGLLSKHSQGNLCFWLVFLEDRVKLVKKNYSTSLEMKIKKQTKEFKTRMSKKKKNLVNYLPQSPTKYYKDLPFKPGLDFYRILGDSTFNLNSLGTFIPDTMISMGKLTWIQWEPNTDSPGGSNKRRDNDFVLLNYAEHLKVLEATIYDRSPGESDKPVAIEK